MINMFQRCDWDNDGKLDREEFRAFILRSKYRKYSGLNSGNSSVSASATSSVATSNSGSFSLSNSNTCGDFSIGSSGNSRKLNLSNSHSSTSADFSWGNNNNTEDDNSNTISSADADNIGVSSLTNNRHLGFTRSWSKSPQSQGYGAVSQQEGEEPREVKQKPRSRRGQVMHYLHKRISKVVSKRQTVC